MGLYRYFWSPKVVWKRLSPSVVETRQYRHTVIDSPQTVKTQLPYYLIHVRP